MIGNFCVWVVPFLKESIIQIQRNEKDSLQIIHEFFAEGIPYIYVNWVLTINFPRPSSNNRYKCFLKSIFFNNDCIGPILGSNFRRMVTKKFLRQYEWHYYDTNTPSKAIVDNPYLLLFLESFLFSYNCVMIWNTIHLRLIILTIPFP